MAFLEHECIIWKSCVISSSELVFLHVECASWLSREASYSSKVSDDIEFTLPWKQLCQITEWFTNSGHASVSSS